MNTNTINFQDKFILNPNDIKSNLNTKSVEINLIPNEIWKTVFNFLETPNNLEKAMQDLFHVALTCKSWSFIAEENFNDYKLQILHCIIAIWHQSVGVELNFERKVNYTNKDMSLLKMSDFDQYFFLKDKDIKKSAKDLSTTSDSRNPKIEMEELLESIKEELLANDSNQLFIFDLTSKHATLPGFHFAATRLKIDNLIYLRHSNYPLKINNCFENRKILGIRIPESILNKPILIHELEKNIKEDAVDNDDSTILSLHSMGFSDPYDDSEICRMERLSNLINKISSRWVMFFYNNEIKDLDAIKIASMIREGSRLQGLIFSHTNKLTVEGLKIINESMHHDGRFILQIKGRNSYLQTIKEAIDIFRSNNQYLLTIEEQEPVERNTLK